MHENVITFTWLTPVLIGLIGVVCGFLIEAIRRNIASSLETITSSVVRVEEKMDKHIEKMEKLDLDKRVAILETNFPKIAQKNSLVSEEIHK